MPGVEAARAQLDDMAGWGETGEGVMTCDGTYADGAPVEIVVCKRPRRYDLDDRGDAVAKARALGAPDDWLRIAETIVAREGFNVNRSGVVSVPVVEGRDLGALAFRLGACAHDVHVALLDAGDC